MAENGKPSGCGWEEMSMWGIRNMKYQRCARQARTRSRVPGRRSIQLSSCALSLFVALSAANLAAQDTARQFAGRWDLTLVGASKNLPSWIDVSQDSGQLKVIFVGVTDHATWMKDAKVSNGELSFVSPKGQEGFAYDTTYTLKRVGDRLEGTVSNSDKKWSVTGKHAPTLAKNTAEWGKPIRL